jgi:phospholipase C
MSKAQGIGESGQPRLSWISAAGDGSVWGLDENGVLTACTRDVVAWEARPVGEKLTGIGAALDGTVYALDAAGAPFAYQNQGGWTAVAPAPAPLASIGVGGADAVWGADVKGQLVSFAAATGTWDVADGPGAAAASVAATLDGSVFCLTTEGAVFLRPEGEGWTELTATQRFAAFAASEIGWVWAVGVDGSLAQYDGQGWQPVGTPGGETLRRVACGTDLAVWALDGKGRLWQFDAAHHAWLALEAPAQLSDIAVGAVGDAWGLGVDGTAYQYTLADALWNPAGAPGTYTRIAAVSKDTVWALAGAAGKTEVTLLRESGGTWSAKAQPAGPVALAAGVDGSVWGAGADGSVLEFDAAALSWRPLPAPPAPAARISAGDAASVTVLDAAGKAYRFDPAAAQWARLTGGDPDAGFLDLAALPGGAAYAIAADGALCLWVGTWVAGAGPDTAVAAGGPANVWALDADSRPLPVATDAIEAAQRVSPGLPGWDAEDVFDETRSTHLWIVNRAIERAAAEGGAIGEWLAQVLQPGAGNNGDPLHTMMCQGIYDADFVAPYNCPVLGIPTYASHFYDPTTGRNWLGQSEPTAWTEGIAHSEASVAAYLRGQFGGTDGAGYHLGLALHFMTDVTQPMHSTNFTFLDSHPFPGYHTAYEGFVLQAQVVIGRRLTPYPLPEPGPNPGDHIRAAAQFSRGYLSSLVGRNETMFYKVYTEAEALAALRTGPDLLGHAIAATAGFLLAWGARTYRRPTAWEDHGRPAPNVTAVTGIGATATDGRPYLFATGSDGNLWVRWLASTVPQRWAWTNQGAAPGGKIASGLGAGTSVHGPAAFMVDEVGSVLAQWWQGEAQAWRWTDLGTPPDSGRSPVRLRGGAVAAQPAGDAALFVLTEDGRLYKNQVPDNQWELIVPPPGAAVTLLLGAAVAVGAPGTAAARCVLVAAEDGQVWIWREQQFAQGVWTQAGAPAGRAVTAGLGVAPYVAVVQCDDGQVYWGDWDPAGGANWRAAGALPDDLTVARGLAVNPVGFPYLDPYVMVRTEEGPVLVGSLVGGSAVWDDRGAPGQSTPVSTVGFLSYQRDFLTAVVGADGRLWA